MESLGKAASSRGSDFSIVTSGCVPLSLEAATAAVGDGIPPSAGRAASRPRRLVHPHLGLKTGRLVVATRTTRVAHRHDVIALVATGAFRFARSPRRKW